MPHDGVDGLLAVDSVGYPEHQAARAQFAAGVGDIFSDEIGHADFATVDGDAHRGDRAQKGGRGEDEDQQEHPEEPFDSFAKAHGMFCGAAGPFPRIWLVYSEGRGAVGKIFVGVFEGAV